MMDEVLDIRMHSKVTKGGRNGSFAALVALGDGKGKGGLGYGNAPGVPMAMEKADTQARQNVVPIAVTAAESIDRLREWASGRCLSADDAGIYTCPSQGRKRRRSVNLDPSNN